MKPLGLKMVPLRIAERTAAVPLLLLILLGLHSLKPSPSLPSSPALPCPTPIYIQVAGKVGRPGVYAFCREPRAVEVLSRADGRKKDWVLDPDLDAMRLASGTKLLVIHEGLSCKVSRGEMIGHYKVVLGIPLSLNRESREGLTAIPGIGPKLAAAIVQERERRGGFKAVDDITGVRGIGKILYRRIQPYLTL